MLLFVSYKTEFLHTSLTVLEQMTVSGFIAHYNDNEGNTASPEFVCNDGTAPKYRGGHFGKVVALIGEQSSEVTMQVNPNKWYFHELCFVVVCYNDVVTKHGHLF